MKKLYEYSENETVQITELHTNESRQRLYEAFGIFPGAKVKIFLISGKKAIILAGRTKLALSAKATEEILA